MGVNLRPAPDVSMERLDPAEWAALARRCPAFGFRQSVPYAERLAEHRRSTNDYWVLREGGKDLGLACARVRTAPVPGAGLAFVSAGPLWSDLLADQDAARLIAAMSSALSTEYVRRRAVTLRLAPPVGGPDRNECVSAALADRGFIASARTPRYRTILVDLRRDPGTIRAGLAQKWRNQLNGAERQEIVVERDTSEGAMERFAPLYEAMMQRKSFASELGPGFYDRVQRSADAPGRLVVLSAVHGGADVAGAVVDLGRETATYILGATTDAGMKCKAAYAMHWAIMMLARDAGCVWYDLGGIDPEGNPGVHHFKAGFGGVDVTSPGPFEMRPPGWKGWVGDRVEELYVRRRRWLAQRKGDGTA